MIRNLFKRSGIYFIGLSASKVLSTFVFILFARSLGPESFGKFVLFNTLILTFTFFFDFGLNQWYQKQAHKEDRRKLFIDLISARIFMLGLSLVIAALLLFVTHSFSLLISVFFLITLVSEAFLSVIDGYFLESKQSFKLSFKTGVRMIIYLLGYITVREVFSFEFAVILYLFSSIMTLLWMFPWNNLKGFQWQPFKKITHTLRSSYAYALLIFSSFAYARGDSLVIGYILKSTALGIYGGAYRFLEGLSLVPTALAHNLFPLSAKESNISAQQLLKMTGVMTVVGSIVGFGLYMTSDFLILRILGEQYREATSILRIFSSVLVLFFINSPLSTVVQSSRYIKNFLPYGIANTVFNIGLNLSLVPVFGIHAAAWIMFTTEFTGLVINLYFVKKVYE